MPASMPLHVHRLIEVNRQNPDLARLSLPPGGVPDNTIGPAIDEDIEYDAARTVLRDSGNGAIECDLIGIAMAEEKVPHIVPVDGCAKRKLKLRLRRHNIDNLPHSLTPR